MYHVLEVAYAPSRGSRINQVRMYLNLYMTFDCQLGNYIKEVWFLIFKNKPTIVYGFGWQKIFLCALFSWPSLILLTFTMEICVYFTILCSEFIICTGFKNRNISLFYNKHLNWAWLKVLFHVSFSKRILKLRKKNNCIVDWWIDLQWRIS